MLIRRVPPTRTKVKQVIWLIQLFCEDKLVWRNLSTACESKSYQSEKLNDAVINYTNHHQYILFVSFVSIAHYGFEAVNVPE